MNAPGDPRRSRSVPCRTATPQSGRQLRAAAPARVRRAVGGHGAGQRRQLHARRGQLLAGDRPVGQPDRRGADPDRRHAAHLPARHTGRRVLSDILDRRRFLIFVQLLLASVSGTLLLLSHTGALTVDYLIALTFVGGIGAALMGPTWQSIVPELVPRADLKGAVALIRWHQYRPRHRPGRRRPDPGQFRRGRDLRHGRAQLCVRDRRPVVVEAPCRRRQHAVGELPGRVPRRPALYAGQRELHRVPLRAAVFFLFASAVWALLPLVARQMLGGSSGFYGVLLGAVGAGRSWARCCCRAWASWTRTAWCCWRPWPARP